ncbi:MAG: MFS transporter [Candidatus Thorarchaeota archaeon]|nr:MFS transporter [Candidatus Thorarchaeota archaeon]
MTSQQSRLPPVVYAVLLTTLFVFMAHNLALSALQDFAKHVVGNESSLGLSFGVFAMSAVIFRLLSGKILGKVNDALVLTAGALLLVLSFGAYYVVMQEHLLYSVRALHGLGWAFTTVALATVLARAAPPSRMGFVMGVFAATNYVTMIVFPSVGSSLVTSLTDEAFRSLFIYTILLSILVLPCSMLVWYRTRGPTLFGLGSRGGLISRPALKPTLSAFLMCLGFGAVLSYTPTIAVMHGSDNPGLFISVLAAGQLVAAAIGGPLSDRRGYSALATLGCLMTSVGLVIAAIGTDMLTYVVSAAIFGLGLGLATVTLNALAALAVPQSEKPHAMATLSAGFDGGITIGAFSVPILLGFGLTTAGALLVSAVLVMSALANHSPIRSLETHARSVAPEQYQVPSA